jgi:hypothetical protein
LIVELYETQGMRPPPATAADATAAATAQLCTAREGLKENILGVT